MTSFLSARSARAHIVGRRLPSHTYGDFIGFAKNGADPLVRSLIQNAKSYPPISPQPPLPATVARLARALARSLSQRTNLKAWAHCQVLEVVQEPLAGVQSESGS